MRPTAYIPLALSLALLPGCADDPPLETSGDTTGGSSSSGEPEDTTVDPTKPPTSTTVDPTTTTASTTNVDPSTTSTTDDPTTTTGPVTDTTTDTTTGETTDTESTTGEPVTTLCERLGGPVEGGIKDLVGKFLGAVLTDTRINGYFLNDDVDGDNLLSMVTDQLGEAVGCEGVFYGGQDMVTAHKDLGISAQDFGDFAEDFSAALDAHQADHPNVTQADKDAILTKLAEMAPDIVEDPDNNKTVYQRVGRKPNIRALIGDPTVPDSFVGVVAADAAINSFFAATDFARLNTCLTRQVAGIDGPTRYGAEVDPPAPDIDPGVGLADKCRDMVSAHEGLQDADMTTITFEDFVALVGDLITAMNTAGVAADPDQAAILGALGPLCDAIVVGPLEKNKCASSQSETTAKLEGIGQQVPDGGYDGSEASMLCKTLNVEADGFDFVDTVELTVGADATWLGDLTIKLSKGAKTLTVLNRPSSAPAFPDDGTGCCGRGVDLIKTSPLLFKNGGATSGKDMGLGLTDNKPQPGAWVCQDDGKCEFAPFPASGPGVDFGDFHGEPADGDWKVCFGDSVDMDLIVLDSVSLKLGKLKYDPTP